MLLYAAIVLIGLVPVNNDFVPTADGIEIFVSSNPVHADVVFPVTTDIINWRDYFPEECFVGNTSAATHVAVGWGDRGFFLETPTWADLKVSTAAHALLWPSDTCLHVTMKANVTTGPNTRSVRISPEQYLRMAEFVKAQFRTDTDRPQQIAAAAYGRSDAFFEARGTYHCCNTCNSWVGNALSAAGIRVGWMTPLPKTVFLYLPEKETADGR